MHYHEPLTKREHEVLALVAQGFTNSQVAEMLVISRATVRQHLNHIYAKLGVTSTELGATSRLHAALKTNTLVYMGQTSDLADP